MNRESDVMGVTDDFRFVRASLLLTCENCGHTGLHPSQIAAVKPRNHSVMLCENCLPDPPEEWT